MAFEYAIKEKCCDWIQSLLFNYQLFSNDLLYFAADMLKTASLSTEELVKLHYYARQLANHIRNCSILNNAEYVPLLDHWINVTQVCDPILQHAWMFFEYYEFPLQKSDIDPPWSGSRNSLIFDDISSLFQQIKCLRSGQHF